MSVHPGQPESSGLDSTGVVGPQAFVLSPFLRDFLLTVLTSVATAVSLVGVSHILADQLTSSDFGAYGLARRLLAIVVPLSTVSMGVAIARQVARDVDGANRIDTLRAGVLVVLVSAWAVIALGWFSIDWWAPRVFGSHTYVAVGRAVLGLALATSVYSVAYAYLRGCERMVAANVAQLTCVALGPLMAAWWFAPRYGLAAVLYAMAALFALAILPLGRWALTSPWRPIRCVGRSLFRYGAGRVPGGLAFTALLAFAPLAAVQVSSLTDAGFVAAGQSILALSEGGITAFGLLLLPLASRYHAQDRIDYLRAAGMSDALAAVVHASLILATQLMIWADMLVHAWLGPEYAPVANIMRVMAAGLVPYLVFAALRSYVDAVEPRAVNTGNLVIALVCAVVAGSLGVLLTGSVVALVVGTSLGMFVLGTLTLRFLLSEGLVDFSGLAWRALLPPLAVSTLLSWGLSRVPGLTVAGELALFVVALGGTGLMVGWWLRRRDVGWIRQIRIRIGRGAR